MIASIILIPLIGVSVAALGSGNTTITTASDPLEDQLSADIAALDCPGSSLSSADPPSTVPSHATMPYHPPAHPLLQSDDPQTKSTPPRTMRQNWSLTPSSRCYRSEDPSQRFPRGRASLPATEITPCSLPTAGYPEGEGVQTMTLPDHPVDIVATTGEAATIIAQQSRTTTASLTAVKFVSGGSKVSPTQSSVWIGVSIVWGIAVVMRYRRCEWRPWCDD